MDCDFVLLERPCHEVTFHKVICHKVTFHFMTLLLCKVSFSPPVISIKMFLHSDLVIMLRLYSTKENHEKETYLA